MSILNHSSNESIQPTQSVESVKVDLILTPKVEKGESTYRVFCNIITYELDPGDPDHEVPIDSQMIDLVVTQKPTSEVVEKELENNGYDLTFKWRLMDWWQPETEGYPDVF